MPIITGIVPSPDKPGHVVILVDGVAFATVPEASAADLAPGQSSPAGPAAPPRPPGAGAHRPPGEGAQKTGAGAQKTYERALRLLSFRARSAKELEKRLIEKGEPRDHVAAAIQRLCANGLLDDARFAEAKARSGILGRPRSRRRIEQDLARKGVARDVADAAIRQVMADEGTDELAVAERAARKKLRTLARLDPAEQRQKVYAFLARQGYAPDVVRRALRAVMDARDAPPPDGEVE
ncbi:regulatory protein RecX [Sorangium sp. So ce1099]|uniref:regulatory protein RecX n=1 Tax=Sorangium sp. So ce1099 TaxID=3133331 RepID=UPI003F5E1BBC